MYLQCQSRRYGIVCDFLILCNSQIVYHKIKCPKQEFLPVVKRRGVNKKSFYSIFYFGAIGQTQLMRVY